jgi:predicted O-methyltransferase YrrM
MNEAITRVLHEIEESSKKGQFWNVPFTTANFLHMLVKAVGAKKVLEIGTSNGYSGIYLAEALSGQGGVLYTVESHRERFLLAQENFQKSGLAPFIQQIFGHAPEILTELPGDFDLVFIDATKMEYKSYLEVLLPKVRRGGLIVADNALSHGEEMRDYFEFLEKLAGVESVLLPFDNGVFLSRINN